MHLYNNEIDQVSKIQLEKQYISFIIDISIFNLVILCYSLIRFIYLNSIFGD